MDIQIQDLNIRLPSKFLISTNHLVEINNVFPHNNMKKQKVLFDEYSKFFPNFKDFVKEKEPKEIETRRMYLKDVDPVIFGPTFSKSCGKAKEPTLVEIDTSSNDIKTDDKLMLFPLFGERQKRAYTCNHKTFPFIGIKSEPDGSSFPCCYSETQLKQGKYRLQYESGNTEQKEFKGTSKNILISDKIARPDVEGELPEYIYKFLTYIDPTTIPIYSDNKFFLRVGSLRDKNSALDAIVKSLYAYKEDIKSLYPNYSSKYAAKIKSSPILSYIFNSKYPKATNKQLILSNIRKSLVEFLPTHYTAQNSYGYSCKDLQEMLSGIGYFDVNIFWKIIEQAFDITLIVFKKTHEDKLGTLGSPRFMKYYLRNDYDDHKLKPTIMLYESVGSSVDNAEFPQVELIRSYFYDGTNTPIIYDYINKSIKEILIRNIELVVQDMFS